MSLGVAGRHRVPDIRALDQLADVTQPAGLAEQFANVLERLGADRLEVLPHLTVPVKEFPGRSHYGIVGDNGWEEVADYALSWATRFTSREP